jgi:C_GCAxxG_C_C family probable redox protein
MKKTEAAISLFKKGFNCSQSLLAAYGPEMGIDREIALKIGSAFGGGIGRMGETCGAVIGAFMIIGLKHGITDAKDKKAKTKIYRLVEKFVERFKARNNSIICRELLGVDRDSIKRLNPSLKRIIKKQCPKYIRDSIEIIEEILYEKTHSF